jgi:hypothetical protein
MSPRAGHAAAALLLLGLGACNRGGDGEQGPDNGIDNIVISAAPGGARASGPEVVTVAPDGSSVDAAATPMNAREAVLGILNKRNGEAREFKLKPGQAVRIGDVIVRLRACDRTAPWEIDQLTGAFVQVDVLEIDRKWHRAFSGWLYKERPALNVVQHPIYDVWPKSCAMTFRDSGEATEAAPAAGGGGSGSRSSAKKSPSTSGSPAARPADESPSAAASNAT